MNEAHIHLVVNHLPVFASLFSFLLLLAALVLRSKDLERAACVGLLFAALSAGAAFYTGEPAEDIAETLPDVTHELIHEHEEAAEWAFRLAVAEGVLAGAFLVFSLQRKNPPNFLRFTIIVGSLVSSISMVNTARLGGDIRHTEARSDFNHKD